MQDASSGAVGRSGEFNRYRRDTAPWERLSWLGRTRTSSIPFASCAPSWAAPTSYAARAGDLCRLGGWLDHRDTRNTTFSCSVCGAPGDFCLKIRPAKACSTTRARTRRGTRWRRCGCSSSIGWPTRSDIGQRLARTCRTARSPTMSRRRVTDGCRCRFGRSARPSTSGLGSASTARDARRGAPSSSRPRTSMSRSRAAGDSSAGASGPRSTATARKCAAALASPCSHRSIKLGPRAASSIFSAAGCGSVVNSLWEITGVDLHAPGLGGPAR
jgi:hypothetical protein